MAWIESHQELARHPKLLRACSRLGVSRPAMIGHLHLLWWWALDYAPDGDVSRFGDEELARAAEWEGESGEFRKALVYAGFLDADRKLHDWDDYAGKLLDRRRRNAESHRRAREKHVTLTSPSRHEDSPGTHGDAQDPSSRGHPEDSPGTHGDSPVIPHDVTGTPHDRAKSLSSPDDVLGTSEPTVQYRRGEGANIERCGNWWR